MKYKLPKCRSIIFTWLLSYMLVLMVPVLVSTITYIQTANVVQNESNNSNTLLLRRFQNQIDSLLNNVERLGQEITGSQRIGDLTRIKSQIDTRKIYDMFLVSKELRTYEIANNSVNELYIYYNNVDYVISSSIVDESKSFFDIYLDNIDMSYGEWHKLVSGFHRGDYIAVSYKHNADKEEQGQITEEEKKIIYIKTIPYYSQGEYFANMLIALDTSSIMDFAKDIELFNKGSIMIIDKNDNLMAALKSLNDLKDIKYENLVDKSGVLHKKINGNKVVISYDTSKVAPWKYVSIVPESAFWEKVKYVRNITFISLSFCLMLGGLITYLALKRNYNPLNKLVKLVENHDGLRFDKNINEFSFIQNVINKTFEDKEKIDNILLRQNKVLRSGFLTRLLKGKVEKIFPVEELLLLYDIDFKYKYFAVMIFYIDDFGDAFYEENQSTYSDKNIENFRLVQFIVTNVIEELIGQKNQGFMTDIDDMMICIVNFNEANVSDGKRDMWSAANQAQEFLEKHYNIHFMVSISNIHETLSGINQAYNEALQAMEYKKILGIEEIVYFEDISVLPKGNYYYPLEIEQKLINYIKLGDFEKSRILLDEVYRQNFEESVLSIKITRCLMFNLVSTMIKTINEVSSREYNDFLEELNPIEKLLEFDNINDMKNELIILLKTFCDYINEREKNKANDVSLKLKDDVIKYINKNYMEVEMSLTRIADYFNVHPVYLSKCFREQTGDRLLDYINKLRISKAKELLKGKYGTVDNVSIEVGYASTKTFTRTFKKYEGITPGKYKEI